MAVPAERPTHRRYPERNPDQWVEIRLAAAKLYGAGWRRSNIAKALADKAYPHVRYRDSRVTRMRAKLARWELVDEFRDLVYQHAVVKLDLAAPAILQGLTRSAVRGRVDAARLALELTGRHVPKGDGGNTNIVLAMGNIPRPMNVPLDQGVVDAVAEEVDE